MPWERGRIHGAGSAAAALVCAVFLIGGTATPDAQSPSAPAAARGELLVKFKAGATGAHKQAAFARVRARLRGHFSHLDIDRVDVPADSDPVLAAAAIQADPSVLYAQPNFVRHVVSAASPNDPAWVGKALWALTRISAPSVWSTFPTAAHDVVIAVIDTGVNYRHPDLAASAWTNPGEVAGNGLDDDGNGYADDVHGVDLFNQDGDPMDDNGHGTHVAGTIGAQGDNGVGGVGVAWNPQVLACKFLDATGTGLDANAIACFEYVIDLKVNRGINVRVTNNSWGSLRNQAALFPQALKDAVDAAGQAGIVNVFAAGNDAVNADVSPFDPASFTSTSIVSVAASDESDARASFSNYGAQSIDLAAPGTNIYSTYLDSYGYWSGTSMAAPHVSGTLALMASQNAALTPEALKARLLGSVDALSQWSGVTVTGGRLNAFAALLAATGGSNPGGGSPPASEWSHADVGSTGAAGNSTASGGTFQVTGAGADVWGAADAFQYAYQTLNGDGSIVARVTSIEYVNSWTKAGVMIRNSLSPSAAQAFMLVAASPSKGVPFQRRTADGAGSVSTSGSQSTSPRWVKLVRAGATITAYESADGAGWTMVGRDTFSMNASVLVGLAVSSHVTGTLASATFDSVTVTQGVAATPPPPSPVWASTDVGATPFAGRATVADGVYTVTGSGADIWGTADAFHYAYTPLSGDATIVARVTAVEQNVSAWVKAGVMVRETLDAGSPHALMLVSTSKGTAFQRRQSASGTSASTAGTLSTAPRWVKLQRRGNVFTAYESADGVSWTLVGSDTIAMGANVYAGLAVTSHTTAASATCAFDRVTIQ
jgi:subtilisin family serine protease